MSHRYFHPELRSHSTITLGDQEAVHLIKVMRKELGESLMLFDGRGGSCIATIKEVRKKEVELTTGELVRTLPPVGPKFTLALAPPKGERLDLIIEKGTELGIDQFDFIQTSRSVVVPGDQKIQRLEQLATAACKQSGRNFLPCINPVISLESWLKKRSSSQKIILADPGGIPWNECYHQLESTQEIVIGIGPEGGFTDKEICRFTEQGGVKISVATHILRVETAALAFASLLAASFRVNGNSN